MDLNINSGEEKNTNFSENCPKKLPGSKKIAEARPSKAIYILYICFLHHIFKCMFIRSEITNEMSNENCEKVSKTLRRKLSLWRLKFQVVSERKISLAL